MTDEASAVTEDFFNAIAAGDLDKVKAIYADDVVVWHNTDKAEKGKDASVGTIQWLFDNIGDFKYVDVRNTPFPGGVLRRHFCQGVVRGTGQKIDLAIAVVAEVKNGQIVRLEEYLDSAQGASGVPLGAD